VSAARDQLAAVADAVEILSRTRYSWLGDASAALEPHVERGLSDADARGYLAYALQHRLYADFYCLGGPGRSSGRHSANAMRGEPDLVEALSAVNSGAGPWEGGWTLRTEEGDAAVVESGGLALTAGPGEWRRPGAGDAVDVRYPKELLRLSPGFYMALGDVALEPSADLLRLYWNIDAPGAVVFVQAATRVVNERALPARLKVVNDPAMFERCDTAVVYLERSRPAEALQVAEELHAIAEPHLAQAVPALTRALAPGLGLAEDPGGGQSFGLHRCGLIADGLLRAHERGLTEPDDRVDAVAERLREEGIDPDAPHLTRGSDADYPASWVA
jgi:HopA1 effector protein family